MIEVKYLSKQFGKMTNEEFDLWGDALLIKLHAITGWTIPEKTIGKVLVDQFKKKLIESYPNCNTDEIEYAFRKNKTQVSNWGKNMNLSSIDEVMKPYLEERFDASRMEEHLKSLPPAKEEPIPINDKIMIEWLTDVFKNIKDGKHKFEFVPVDLYEWLDKRGNIKATNEEKKKYFDKSVENLYTSLLGKMDEKRNIDNIKAFEVFKKMKEENKFSGNEKETVKRNAKKMLLFDIIQNSSTIELIYECF